MIKGKLYIHKNKLNGKCYVGVTQRKPSLRWGKNGIGYKDQPVFYSAINKYGWNNFEHIILPEVYKTIEELDKAEIKLIEELKSYTNGYNASPGGASWIPTSDSRENLSKALKGKKKSKSFCLKMKNRVYSNEHRKHLSESVKKSWSNRKPIEGRLKDKADSIKKALIEKIQTPKEIMETFNISPTHLYRINRGEAYYDSNLVYPLNKKEGE